MFFFSLVPGNSGLMHPNLVPFLDAHQMYPIRSNLRPVNPFTYEGTIHFGPSLVIRGPNLPRLLPIGTYLDPNVGTWMKKKMGI